MKIFICIFLMIFITNLCSQNINDEIQRRDMVPFVVGGVPVPISMYPSVAFIKLNGYPHCGGVIISDRTIISAGHCSKDRKGNTHAAELFTVYLGSSNLKNSAIYKVCKVKPHESYTPRNYTNDISIFLLTRSIIFGKVVQKALIAPDEKWKQTKYIMRIAGFGLTSTDGRPSETLINTRMHYVDEKTCNMSQQGAGSHSMPVVDHMFCMIGEYWSSDCFGDSGSGIFWKKYLVGLVATGRDASCGSDVMPSMYTNVVYFKNWIMSNVKKLESLKPGQCKNDKLKINSSSTNEQRKFKKYSLK